MASADRVAEPEIVVDEQTVAAELVVALELD
jgi:hypothetical protein